MRICIMMLGLKGLYVGSIEDFLHGAKCSTLWVLFLFSVFSKLQKILAKYGSRILKKQNAKK